MSPPPTPTLNLLHHALTTANKPLLTQALTQLPTTPPPTENPAHLISTLQTILHATHLLTESLHSTTPSSHLQTPALYNWAAATLSSFHNLQTILTPLALLLRSLALNNVARTAIGKAGLVDQLAALWPLYPATLEIPAALASLCVGHIDNVSRVMRNRALVVAIRLLTNHNPFDNLQRLKHVLLLVASCAICTPDNQHEATALVPVLLDVLHTANDRRIPSVAELVVSALRNMSECWIKEHHGYVFHDYPRLVHSVLNMCTANPRSARLPVAAARALLALHTACPSATDALMTHHVLLRRLLARRSKPNKALGTLIKLLDEHGGGIHARQGSPRNPSDTEPQPVQSPHAMRLAHVPVGGLQSKRHLRKCTAAEGIRNEPSLPEDDNVVLEERSESETAADCNQPPSPSMQSPIRPRKRAKRSTANKGTARPSVESSKTDDLSRSDTGEIRRSVREGLARAAMETGDHREEATDFEALMLSRSLAKGKQSTHDSKVVNGDIRAASRVRRSCRERKPPRKYTNNVFGGGCSTAVASTVPSKLRRSLRRGNARSASEDRSTVVGTAVESADGAAPVDGERSRSPSATARFSNRAQRGATQCNANPVEMVVITSDNESDD